MDRSAVTCPECDHDRNDHVHYCPADVEVGTCDCSATVSAERLAKQLFLYRTSSNIPLPEDFWERQSATMREPFIAEAGALIAGLDND